MKELLEEKGIEIEEHYSLVNNFGYLINYKGFRFDLRFWANCYGASLNSWDYCVFNSEKQKETSLEEAENYIKEIVKIANERRLK